MLEPADSYPGKSSCERETLQESEKLEWKSSKAGGGGEIAPNERRRGFETSLLREHQLLSVSVQSREIETKSFQITIEKRMNKNQLAALDSE